MAMTSFTFTSSSSLTSSLRLALTSHWQKLARAWKRLSVCSGLDCREKAARSCITFLFPRYFPSFNWDDTQNQYFSIFFKWFRSTSQYLSVVLILQDSTYGKVQQLLRSIEPADVISSSARALFSCTPNNRVVFSCFLLLGILD